MKRGLHYMDKFALNKPDQLPAVGCECNTSDKIKGGYKHIRRTNYISEYVTRLILNDDGTAKAVTKCKKNYRADWQFSTYFDEYGREIIGSSTRAELLEYMRIKRMLK